MQRFPDVIVEPSGIKVMLFAVPKLGAIRVLVEHRVFELHAQYFKLVFDEASLEHTSTLLQLVAVELQQVPLLLSLEGQKFKLASIHYSLHTLLSVIVVVACNYLPKPSDF